MARWTGSVRTADWGQPAAFALNAQRPVRTQRQRGIVLLVNETVAVVIETIADFWQRIDATTNPIHANLVRAAIGVRLARHVAAAALPHDACGTVGTERQCRILLLVDEPIAIVVDAIAYFGCSRANGHAYTRSVAHRASRTPTIRTAWLRWNAMAALTAIRRASPSARRRIATASRRITRIRIRIRNAVESRRAASLRAAQRTRLTIARIVARRANAIDTDFAGGAI